MEKDWGQIAKETGGVESQRDRGEIAKVGSNRKETPENIGGVESQRRGENAKDFRKRLALVEMQARKNAEDIKFLERVLCLIPSIIALAITIAGLIIRLKL